MVVSILLVAALSLSSLALLLFAFVIWFAEVINSLPLSLCITGVAMAISAWVTYKIALSAALKELREEYQRAMSIISLLRYGYDCAIKRLTQLLLLFK
ncbi:MAG: hypothetical protein R3Y55_04140 [Rikenellaceae bacterium]